jgi:HD superfamily phosphodiesterase|tara:strand:- start:571 stop:1212 length:642 start_codon:yes stop_codon:yes gene_type:complete
MLIPLANIYSFVIGITSKYNIDESHGLRHSMDAFKYSEILFNSEKNIEPLIIKDERIIYTSALLHDMCDKKYMPEMDGIKDIKHFLKSNAYYDEEIDSIISIISNVSYSKIKKNGMPNLNTNQYAFNIVRESDLLCAYDVDRCIIYDMMKKGSRYEDAFIDAKNLFNKRVFKHFDDKLFSTKTGIEIANDLEIQSKERIKEIEKTLSNIKTKS